jgi:alkylated DNA nucleotide flippase Atl1
VDVGVQSPPTYRETAAGAPTPRQLRPLLNRIGVDSTVALFRQFRTDGAVTPILDSEDFQTALLFELVESGRQGDAGKLYRFFAESDPDLILAVLWWVDTFSAIGDDATAAPWLRVARALDPTHPEVIRR